MSKKPPEQSERPRGNSRPSLSARLESVRYLNSSSASRTTPVQHIADALIGAMDETHPDLHPLQRNVILVLLLALAAAAWAVLVWEHRNAAMDMAMASPDIGLRAPLFLAMWVVVMMVAMMFPAAAPMIVAFHRVQAGKHRLGDAFVSTSVFVAAYLLVWVSVGFVALCRSARRRSQCGAHRLQYGSDRRGNPHNSRSLPAHPIQGGMPRKVSHAHPLHYDLRARRDSGCI